MNRLAIFLDGANLRALTREEGLFRIDYERLAKKIHSIVAAGCVQSIELLRTYYYDCMPYQARNHVIGEENTPYANMERFLNSLEMMPRYKVRLGTLKPPSGEPDSRPVQKGVDLLMGIDISLLSAKRHITHAAVVTSDSDFVPALEAAKAEGVVVWLFHPSAYYSQKLRNATDEWITVDREFLESVRLIR